MNKAIFPALAGLLFLTSISVLCADESKVATGSDSEAAKDAAVLARSGAGQSSGANTELKNEQERLTLENTIAEQKLLQELADLTAEKQRLETESALALARQTAELAGVKAEIEVLTQKAAAIAKRAEVGEAERKAAVEAELAGTRTKLEQIKAANELAAAELAGSLQTLQAKDQEVQLRMKELQLERAEFEMAVAKFNAELELWEKRGDLRNRVDREIEYTNEPFQDGVLTVSDRRISLNGPIMMDMADHVTERIDYFNNQSTEFPIFIVIDSSPGGSVMAGYRILKAMEGSPAPVYVVVKSLAASMAAGITTLAEKSFAYPNAIILHHQLMSGNFGNLTQQREGLTEMEEWWRRLATPVAAKMGIGLDEFVEQMYQKSSTGDWREFADQATEIRWVDHIVDTIREESLIKNPDLETAASTRQPVFPFMEEKVDSDGRRHTLLPRLDPFDYYYLYNPDGYYRLTP